MEADAKRKVEEFNKLLSEELAAVETYDLLGQEHQPTIRLAEIRGLRDDHADAARKLCRRIKHLGGTPLQHAKAWDLSDDNGANPPLVAEAAALRGLQESEEHELSFCREVLRQRDVPDEVKHFIRDCLIPRQQAHVDYLRGTTEAH